METDPEKRAEIYAQINAENQLAAQYAIPNELDRLYTGMGERALNAHTWVEETVYKVDLPANRLEQWAKVEAERFHQPVFRLFQTELETVYEEKNRSMDDKDRVILTAMQAMDTMRDLLDRKGFERARELDHEPAPGVRVEGYSLAL